MITADACYLAAGLRNVLQVTGDRVLPIRGTCTPRVGPQRRGDHNAPRAPAGDPAASNHRTFSMNLRVAQRLPTDHRFSTEQEGG